MESELEQEARTPREAGVELTTQKCLFPTIVFMRASKRMSESGGKALEKDEGV